MRGPQEPRRYAGKPVPLLPVGPSAVRPGRFKAPGGFALPTAFRAQGTFLWALKEHFCVTYR